MKHLVLVALFAFVISGCAAHHQIDLAEHRAPGHETHQGVAPRDLPVESFVLVDTEEANSAAAAATAEGEQWPLDALAVAQRFAGPMDGRYVSIEKMDEPGEHPSATTVTIVRGGFLDDSVWGDWNQLLLSRQADGTWLIDEARRAWRCYRGHQTEYFSERWCL